MAGHKAGHGRSALRYTPPVLESDASDKAAAGTCQPSVERCGCFHAEHCVIAGSRVISQRCRCCPRLQRRRARGFLASTRHRPKGNRGPTSSPLQALPEMLQLTTMLRPAPLIRPLLFLSHLSRAPLFPFRAPSSATSAAAPRSLPSPLNV